MNANDGVERDCQQPLLPKVGTSRPVSGPPLCLSPHCVPLKPRRTIRWFVTSSPPCW